MGRVSLKARLKRLERSAAKGPCPACGPERVWVVERAEEAGRLVCERCGRDWTGKTRAVLRALWDEV